MRRSFNLREPMLFAAIGALQGAVFYATGAFRASLPGLSPGLLAAIHTMLLLMPWTYFVVRSPAGRWQDLTFSGALALSLSLAAWRWLSHEGGIDAPSILVVVLAAVVVLAVPVYQEQVAAGGGDDRHGNGWFATFIDDALIVAGGVCLSLMVWGILLLWSALFSAAQAPWLKQLLVTGAVPWIIKGVAFGSGVAFVRGQRQHLTAARRFLLAPLARLSPLFGLGAGAFLLLLPFITLEPLWATTKATPILLGLAAVGLLLVNVTFPDSSRSASASPLLRKTATVHLVAVPILIALAGYSTWLRIDHHGLTVARFYALFGIAALAVIAVTYLIAAIPTGRWQRLSRLNAGLATAIALALVLTLTPALDPLVLVAQHQRSRLAGGRIEPERFDFGYLRWRLGQPGRDALAELVRRDDLPHRDRIATELKTLEAASDYSDWRRAQESRRRAREIAALGALASYVVIRPTGASIPLPFVDYLMQERFITLRECATAPLQRCAIIAQDLMGDERPEYVVANRIHAWISVTLYREREGGWTPRFFKNSMVDGEAAAAAWRAIEQGDIGRLPPLQWDLRLGDVRVRTDPEVRQAAN